MIDGNRIRAIQVETGNYIYILFRKLNIKDIHSKFIFNGQVYRINSQLTFEEIGMKHNSMLPIIKSTLSG